MSRNGNDAGAAWMVVLLIIGVVVAIAVKNFSDSFDLPWEVGGSVLLGFLLSAIIAAGTAFGLVRMNHPRPFLVAACVLLASIAFSLFPAFDVWAAKIPVLALPGYGPSGGELEWWGGKIVRWIYAGVPAGAAIFLFWKNDY